MSTAPLDPEVGALLADAVERALGGEPEAVALELAALLRTGVEGECPERAAVEYVLAIAQNESGAGHGAVRSATRCLDVADGLGSPGWAANALAVRAIAHERLGLTAEAVDDLVRAEHEIGGCDDDGLRAWAHSWLGTAYQEMRLYELASPHYERCGELGADPIPLATSAFVDQLSLATLHGEWAIELTLLGATDGRSRRERAHLRESAVAHAERALALCSPRTPPHQVLRARFLRAQHAATVDETMLAELRDLRLGFLEAGDDERSVATTATLAAALAAVGQVELAAAEAQRALDAIPVDADFLTGRHVLWVHLRLAEDRGEPFAGAGLALGVATSRTWWAHRASRLATMRSAITGYAQRRGREAEYLSARRDALTGLGNRRAFDEWLAGPDSVDGALVTVDVDRLKQANDTWGHAAGDEVIVAVGRALVLGLREQDHAFRLGGDEFAVALVPGTLEDATTVGRRIGARVAEVAAGAAEPALAALSVSIGCAATSEGLPAGELAAVADRRMYESKRSGRRLHHVAS
ncbi:diguanylate cyclase [Solicola sp. PLA-1-18]|uniref:GGDEF domain-containing protein n=1 Tax=Solicola sp. PLA-1-18 TaxID=3380532 RepID=UPI003B80E39F